MRRVVQWFAVVGIIAATVLGFAGPASATQSDVGDFTFDSFSADYYLDTDADGRSTLTTVETFVAVFPEADQNHGMRRAIPEQYQGAPTDITVTSVTDGTGTARPFETESDDDGFLLVTSAEDEFVHGRQTYVFTYTQHNVTRFFADTDDDEFYWDTVGTGWDQPFGEVRVSVHIPAELASALTGNVACYQGPEGATTGCESSSSEEPDGTVISASVGPLAPRENLSIAIGFESGTFVPRDSSYFGSGFGVIQVISALAAGAAAVWALVLRATRFADGRGRPTVIAEYAPPKSLDIFVAAGILGKSNRAVAAAFIDLAVRGRIRIIESPKTGFFARGQNYTLQLIDASSLTGSELELARGLFGEPLLPGTEYVMKSSDTKLSARVRSIIAEALVTAGALGLRKRGVARFAVLPVALALLAAVLGFVAGLVLISNARGGVLSGILIAPGIIGVIVVLAALLRRPLTDAGAELRDHLAGLELYIRLAEADRLRVLQSPSGAESTPISTADPRQVLDVYEKLLPYAVLFGLEKQWAVELGRYYLDSTPEWYSGSGAFNAGLFAASIGSMSSAAASSYSGSSSSSSSGGSGGGGSSGGGGGGGGGGGV